MLNKLDLQNTHSILENSPLGLLLLDKDNIACWANETMKDWLGSRTAAVLGKKAGEMEDTLNRLFETETSVHLSATDDSEERWLMSTTLPLDDGGSAHFFTDVSPYRLLIEERDQLLNKVEELTLADEDTGMPNRRALFHNLESHVSRSRRYGNTLSILLLEIANLDEFARHDASATAVPLLIAIRNMLNDQLRWADTIGRLDEREFLLILPETRLEDANKVATMLAERLKNLPIEGHDEGFAIDYRLSAASWQKGDDPRLLLQRARDGLDSRD